MAPEDAVELAELPQLFFREEPLFLQHDVKRDAAVSLAQDEAVPFGPVRAACIEAHHSVEQHAQHFDDRQ
jgi:hypothetical protein